MAIIRTSNDYSNDYNEYGQKATFVGITENPSASDQTIPVVYGCRKIEGIRFWNEVSSTNQSILYCAYALSEDWCLGISQIYIDDNSLAISSTDLQHRIPKIITTGKYSGVLEVEFVDGRSQKTEYGTVPNIGPSTILGRDFTTNPSNAWTGLCYLVCKFVYATSSPYTKLPKVTCNLFGRKIPTFITGSDLLVYSDNPAYIIWDLMSNTRYGKSISKSSIDESSFTAVANACAVKRQGQVSGGQNIFRCNWICDLENPVLDNINLLLETYQINLSYIQDKWTLSIESSPQSSAYGTFPYITFSDDNVVGDVDVQYPSLSEKFNQVTVEYIEPAQNFQLSSVSYSAGISDDNDTVLSKQFTSNLVTSKVVAYDIAKMTLLRSRNQILYKFKANREAHQCRVGEYAYLQTTIPFTNNQKIIITGMTMNQDYTFDIEAVSYDPAWYPASFTDNVTLPYDPGTGVITTPSVSWSITSDRDSVGYVLEGQTVTYTILTEGVSTGSTFTWSITGNVTQADFDSGGAYGGTNGSGTITAGTATIIKVAAVDTIVETDELIYMTIRDSNGLSVAFNQLKLKDYVIPSPTVVPTYTFSAPTLSDNSNWYLGWLKAGTSTNSFVFDTTKTSRYTGGGAPSGNLGFYAQVNKITTTTILLDFRIGLIDRLVGDISKTYTNLDIGITWSNGAEPLGYRYTGSSPNNYGIEQWQWDYETPPIPIQPTLAKLIGGGTRWSPSTQITSSPTVLKMRPVAGMRGGYEFYDNLKIPIDWSGNGVVPNTGPYWFASPIDKVNNTSGYQILFKFYDLTNKKYIGQKIFQFKLTAGTGTCFSDATYAASTVNWLATMGTRPY